MASTAVQASTGSDPAAVTGSGSEKLEQVRKIHDDIKAWLLQPSLTAIYF